VKGWFGDVRRAREALDRVLSTLRAASDPVMKELYISRVADRLGIPRDTVAVEAKAPSRPAALPARQPPLRSGRHESGGPGEDPPTRVATGEVERFLLRLFINHPGWLDRARDELAPDLFVVRSHRKLFETLLATPPGSSAPVTPPGLHPRLQELFERVGGGGPFEPEFDIDRWYVGSLSALEERSDFDSIASDPDPASRVRRRQALSPEGSARFSMYLRNRSRPETDRVPPPEED
jgi:DNA primase